MTAEAASWRVGIVGISSAGLFLLERLSLHPQAQIVGIYEPDAARHALAANSKIAVWDRPSSASSSTAEILIFAGNLSADLIASAIKQGKNVVLHEPWRLTSVELSELGRQSTAARCVATVSCLRRWSTDFASAQAAIKTGRIGPLQTIRLVSCEQTVNQSDPTTGIMREFGYHWLDQLFLLADSKPQTVFAQRFQHAGEPHEHGVWITVEFANGCRAQIDLQSRSRLGLRTGWILEGTTGSYRNDRLYTRTEDGEIVDEPLPHPVPIDDAFLNDLFLACQGETTRLPTLIDAASVVKLIEQIDESARF